MHSGNVRIPCGTALPLEWWCPADLAGRSAASAIVALPHCIGTGRSGEIAIPDRADTLRVLWLMGERAPILMLCGSAGGYCTRRQLQPEIARWPMESGCIAESGRTGCDARMLALTDIGARWRAGRGALQKLRLTRLG